MRPTAWSLAADCLFTALYKVASVTFLQGTTVALVKPADWWLIYEDDSVEPCY